MQRFAKWLGRWQDHDLLAFDQSSWSALAKSIGYIAGVGQQVLAAGRDVHWSVPVGGWGGYESVRDRERDDVYQRIADQILALYPAGKSRICIRLPWEFNLNEQSQRAKTWDGRWDGTLYKLAFRRIAHIFRETSPRFYFDWCPNAGLGGIDATSCYPGDDLVDVVSVDIYYRGRYDDQGQHDGGSSVYRYRREQDNGLDWLLAFGRAHGKLIGLSEWGVDDNSATAYTSSLIAWIKAVGPRLSHHNYWDRTDGGANCRISDGSLPAIGAAYRAAFRS